MWDALRLLYESAETGARMKGTTDMKYILLMSAPMVGFDAYRKWSNEDVQAHMAALKKIGQDLSESHEFVTTHGLAWPDQAKLVRSGKNGAPITDGVFPESKEFLAGYWIVDVESPERAYEIANRISGAPGPGGEPLSMPIEVRQIVPDPPSELP
jgi:hypothetical protein